MPDPLPPIRHPSRYIPLTALATGEPGLPALAVGTANPLPSREAPLRSARGLAPGNIVEAGAAILIDCSASGRAIFVLADGSQLPLTISAGLTMLPLAVTGLAQDGQTAALTAWVLD